MRFLVVVFLLGDFEHVIDTVDFEAIKTISFSIIFVHKTVKWVERSLKFFFFQDFLRRSCYNSFGRGIILFSHMSLNSRMVFAVMMMILRLVILIHSSYR